MKRKRVLVLSVLSLLAVAVLYLSSSVLSDYEVVNKGQLLPYTKGYIYEILIGGRYTLFVEPEVRLTGDVLNSTILVGVSFISLTFASILVHRGDGRHSFHVLFFVLMSIGMFYLAADELLGIHESLGHNMRFLARIPGIKRPDDFIVAVYGLLAVAFLLRFRSIFLQSKQAMVLFGAGLLMFVLAAISDIISLGIEELAEIGVGALILAGTISLGLSVLDKADV